MREQIPQDIAKRFRIEEPLAVLIRKGVARSTGKGSRVYEVSEPLRVQADMPEELGMLLPLLQKKGRLTNRD